MDSKRVKFKAVESMSFSQREEQVQKFWKEQAIFEKSLSQNKDNPKFIFYDGPPFATGLPHYGHLLAGTIKDVVPRYKAMKGYYVPRRFGWDCHGLPVENEIEKEYELGGAASIEAFGIAQFNEACRDIVLRYTSQWQTTVERMGRWVDFENAYRTMDKDFMESVWWVFKQLYDKGLVYQGAKVMPFSWKLGTPLSNFEAGENYKEVDDPSLSVAFEVSGRPGVYFVAWTTTPWTLISNLALAVGADIDYVEFEDPETNKRYILAEARKEAIFGDKPLEEKARYKGKELAGQCYEPLLPYFAEQKEEGAFQVLCADFVSLEEGSGIVHTAPAFGEDDFYVCQENDINLVCPVDANGRFLEPVSDYVGEHFLDVNKKVIRRLKEEGKLVKQATIRHRYPFCWRSDTPLMYRASKTWFVAVEKVKDKLIKNNQEIYWVPGHIKEGRFGKWLEGARDWNISRNRYWGTPIPLWQADDGQTLAVGSVSELETLTGKRFDDLHRHFIDEVTIEKDGKVFRRIPEVFDCWFESGSMPYAQNHHPFSKQELEFPADFIAEGLDQTRGWFYTLNVLASSLFDKPAFKNVIVNGIILAEDGSKMSKRLKNYPDPTLMLDKYGADAIRLYLLQSPAVRADDLCFTQHGVELVLRQVLLPCFNAFSFFLTYTSLSDWSLKKLEDCQLEELDQWILSRLQTLVEQVEGALERYLLSEAVPPMIHFVEELTNWYIRRSRRRFWEQDLSSSQEAGFATLYEVLKTFAKVAAPFIPFLSESIYRQLREGNEPESVHLCAYPSVNKAYQNKELEEAMAAVQQVVSMGHALRKNHKQRVRQPLKSVFVVCHSPEQKAAIAAHEALILDELNVKGLQYLSEDEDLVKVQIKPNYRSLGKKVGPLMKQVANFIPSLSQDQIDELNNQGQLKIVVEGQEIELSPEDLQVHRQVKEGVIASHEQGWTVGLDIELNDALIQEGLARELVNKLNTQRKEQGFELSDRITIVLDTNDEVKQAYLAHQDYINKEALVKAHEFAQLEQEVSMSWQVDKHLCKIQISKV